MIPESTVQKVLAEALKTGGDLAEIYVEDRTSLSLRMEDSKIENAVRGVDQGAGIRVFFGNLVTYAYTDDLSEESLLRAAAAAAAAGKGSSQKTVINLSKTSRPVLSPVLKSFDQLSIAVKAKLLSDADIVARGYNPQVKQFMAQYGELNCKVWMFNSDGLQVEDDRSFVEVGGLVIAQKGDVIQRGMAAFGGQKGLEILDENNFDDSVLKGAESAIKMLDARPAPAGDMTVVICNGWGGVLFHEACGHQMEADFITKGSSAYAGRIGEQVASPLISAYDDGTIPGRRGSLLFDDDGTPSQCTTLIEKGILKEYMWDLVEARRMNRESTGNGRRQSFRHLPMPRMTNTFIGAGENDPEEIIAETKKGIYIKQMAGGQAEIAKGDFVFNATEAYLIEDGKLTAPVRGATVMGNGPKVLSEIDMVGTDLALDPGRGTCGKFQTARVSVGQPTIRIPAVTVGGTDEPVAATMGI
ncbi:MAG: TldD/PmbA family protein [Chloroflexi bacterium]|nr:TldD/PmbA family protein [Chloroflexota bacterium]